MKKYVAGIILLLAFGTLSWSQGAKESFDVQKSRQELEIMRGILNTTLTFVPRNASKEPSRLRFGNLRAFYLAGQGAVFVIQKPGFYSIYGTGSGLGSGIGSGIGGGVDGGIAGGIMSPFDENFSDTIETLNREAADLAHEIAQMSKYANRDPDEDIAPAPAPVPAPAPAPPAPPAPPSVPPKAAKVPRVEKSAQADLLRQQEQVRRNLERAQERVRQTREQAEANRQKLNQALSEIKSYLVETLANYGDSMTTVKPEEYINLVLVSDEFDTQRTKSDVISARKSWITDYKAGKLTLEAFKQKVIQYTE
jgi:hypothetical protein